MPHKILVIEDNRDLARLIYPIALTWRSTAWPAGI